MFSFLLRCRRSLFATRARTITEKYLDLTLALQSLIEYYKEMAVKQIKMPNEAEFQAYYILTHAWANDIVTRCEMELPRHVFLDPKVQLALEIRGLMCRTNETLVRDRASVDGSLNHYARLFNLLRDPKVPYLFAACVHIDFIDIRRGALKAMQKTYYCDHGGFPLEDLVSLLGFNDDDEAIAMLNYHEIEIENMNGQMKVLIGKTRLPDGKVRKGKFIEGKRVSLAPRKSFKVVESKRANMSDKQIIRGVNSGIPMISNSFSIPKPSNTPSIPKPNLTNSSSFSIPKDFGNGSISTQATPLLKTSFHWSICCKTNHKHTGFHWSIFSKTNGFQ